ncbi:MAG: hypothetical protein AAB360_00755 [Patescibacteria group bacterium]
MTRLWQRKIFKTGAILTPALLVLLIPSITYAIEPVWKVLSDTTTETSFGYAVAERWKTVLNMINTLVVAVLIFVAFAQILHLNINTYGIKKVMPSLIFAVIAANFSFLICRFLIDIANIAMIALIKPEEANNAAAKFTGAFGTPEFHNPFAVQPGKTPIELLLDMIFMLVAGIMMLMLAYLLFIRNWILYFLVVLAPLAFMATVLPQTKSVFNQWWSNFIKWTFMPVVSIFWIWLASLWITDKTSGQAIYLTTLFALAAMYLALTTPFKMGGAIMGQWAGLGKKLWGSTGGALLGNAGALAKAKGQSWLESQGAGDKWYSKANPLGWLKNSKASYERVLEHEKKTQEQYQQKRRGNLLGRNKKWQNMFAEEQTFGGDWEMAEKKAMKNLQESPRGQRWMKGREEWRAEMKALETEIAHRDKEAALGVRDDQTNAEFFKRILVATRHGAIAENEIAELDKTLSVNFARKEGPFANDKDRRLSDLYFATLTRSKELDEMVTKADNDRVEAILADQLHVHDTKEAIDRGTRELQKLNQQEERMQELMRREPANAAELVELGELQRQGGARNIRKSEIVSEQNSAIAKARTFVEEGIEQGKTYLAGMVEGNTIRGFAGLVGNDEDLGKLMASRAGKLMSAEVKSDADKLLDKMTPAMIAEELQNINPQVLENFKQGRRYVNVPLGPEEGDVPTLNRKIEAHVLALAKVARQANHPEAPDAQVGLVGMLTDNGLAKAINAYNNRVQPAEQIQTREDLIRKMRDGGRPGRAAFTAVVNQRDVGLLDNPSGYLSLGTDEGSTETAKRIIQTVQQIDPPNLQAQNLNYLYTIASKAHTPEFRDIVKLLKQNGEYTRELLREAQKSRYLLAAEETLHRAGITVDQHNTRELAQIIKTELKKSVRERNPEAMVGGINNYIRGKNPNTNFSIESILHETQTPNTKAASNPTEPRR